MPIIKGKSKKTIQKNIKELVGSKPGVARAKGIATLAAKRGISTGEAKAIQASAIAYNSARISKMKQTNKK